MADPQQPWITKATLQQTAVFLACVASTVALATTTVSSRVFIEPLRYGSAGLFILIVFFLLMGTQKVKRSSLLSIVVLIVLFSLGAFNMLIRGTQVGDLGFILMSFVLTLSLTFAISLRSGDENDSALAVAIIGYAVVYLVVTIAVGGIRFSPVPHFAMEYLSLVHEKDYTISYGQGVTKFFGIAAIAASYLAVNASSGARTVVALALMILFVFLTLLGGARGDAVAVLLVVLFTLRTGRAWVVGLVFLALVASLGYLAAQFEIREFALIERFTRFDSAAALRGGILRDAVHLLAERPDCFLFGCGFNYFQEFFGYPSNVYPHNLFLEYLIVYGAIVTIVSAGLTFVGLQLCWRRSANLGILGPILILFLLVGLKSGTVASSWFVMAGMAFFMGIALASIKQNNLRGLRI